MNRPARFDQPAHVLDGCFLEHAVRQVENVPPMFTRRNAPANRLIDLFQRSVSQQVIADVALKGNSAAKPPPGVRKIHTRPHAEHIRTGGSHQINEGSLLGE